MYVENRCEEMIEVMSVLSNAAQQWGGSVVGLLSCSAAKVGQSSEAK